MSGIVDDSSIHSIFADAVDAAQNLPAHIRQQIKSKFLNNLRLCLTAPVPEGFHGPELMPHMLPAGIRPFEKIEDAVELVPTVVSNHEADVPLDHQIDICSTGISISQAQFQVQLPLPHTRAIILPQQPYVVQLGDVEVNCITAPTRVSCNMAIDRLFVKYLPVFSNSVSQFIVARDKMTRSCDMPLGRCTVRKKYELIVHGNRYFIRLPNLRHIYEGSTTTVVHTRSNHEWAQRIRHGDLIFADDILDKHVVGQFTLPMHLFVSCNDVLIK